MFAKRFVVGLFAGLAAVTGYAGDLEWSGIFRVEGQAIQNPLLDGDQEKNKDYGVHTLILRPRIVAADGIYIDSQFHIFNDAYGGSQLGAVWGGGIGDAAPSGVEDTSAISEREQLEKVRISQFYMTLVQEFGSLLVGRAPMQFGLGMTHSAGRGLFDHYADTRDVLAYKIVLGNFYLTPMIAKIGENHISGFDDVNEIDVHFQYENPESDVEMGVFYQNRKAKGGGNDINPVIFNGATTEGGYNAKSFNIYYLKDKPRYRVGFEVAQQSGDTGVQNANGETIGLSGFGALLEYDWRPESSKWGLGFKAGFATGDDPSTEDEYEGFVFDRNYDVALLMFNHVLGQADVLKTNILGTDATSATDQPDVTAVSNAIFFSPAVRYRWNEQWNIEGRVTTGWLNNAELDLNGALTEIDKNLGYEVDLTLEFKPSERIRWLNQMAMLFPGKAWEANGNFNADSALGFFSRAAVSF